MFKPNNQSIKHCLLIGFLALSAFATNATAALITYQLKDVIFDDGGTATGHFTLNTETQIISNLNIITSGGGIPGRVYEDNNHKVSFVYKRLTVVNLDTSYNLMLYLKTYSASDTTKPLEIHAISREAYNSTGGLIFRKVRAGTAVYVTE